MWRCMQSNYLRLAATSTGIHPSLNLSLQNRYTVIDQLHQRLVRVLSEVIIPTFQDEFVDIELDGAVLYATSNNLWCKVIRTM